MKGGCNIGRKDGRKERKDIDEERKEGKARKIMRRTEMKEWK